jgi:zinc protease
MISALSDIVGYEYVGKLREEMSGVYTVRARASMQKIPYANASLQIMIPCAPDNVDSLVQAAIGVLISIRENGPADKDIVKVKEIKRRVLETNLKTNNYWLTSIQNTLMNGESLEDVTQENLIEQITAGEIQRVANQYFNMENYLQVVLYPEGYQLMEPD